MNCHGEVNGLRFDGVMNSEEGLTVDVTVRKAAVERSSGER